VLTVKEEVELAPPITNNTMAPSAAAEVVEEAEGLRLHLSSTSNSGYRGVTYYNGKPKPYLARYYQGGNNHLYLGMFSTAVEAAVSYARHVLSQQEAIEGAAVGAAEGSAEPDAATVPAATMAPSPAAEEVEEAEEHAEGAQASASNRHPSQQPWGEGLPPGWKRRTDFGVFKGYQGPQGYKARTVPLAWAAHAEMLADIQAVDPKFQAQAGAQAAQRGKRLRAGARVMARYGGGAAWYAGAVAAVRADGSLDIAYDDGDQEEAVPPHLAMPEDGVEEEEEEEEEQEEEESATEEEEEEQEEQEEEEQKGEEPAGPVPTGPTAPSAAAGVVEEAEGLRLHLSSKGSTGYRGVTYMPAQVSLTVTLTLTLTQTLAVAVALALTRALTLTLTLNLALALALTLALTLALA